MKRIESTFDNLRKQKKKALVAYLVAGDPDLETTLNLMEVMVSKGADILELGISFSDPMAEGPTIQHAHERALENKTTLSDALDLVIQFRKKDSTTPIVFMGYMNPFEAMGAENFCSRAHKSGVDGILLVVFALFSMSTNLGAAHLSGKDATFLTSDDETCIK